jgi:hypothetical protein
MTYRGTVKNGVVVLEGDLALPDGMPVEVTPVGDGAPESGLRGAFGIWRDRPGMADSAEAALELRRRVERRGDRA